ncbi:hypothetical protein AAFF_G00303060 [Aldrovandia affinis]|uniref:Uncharacterized protein n=1 Tax=Aldrovandia affinis TaxID=143900 RepID=A0AAD7R905_9TELE|nr:hypothetical protein AAFF_G00303060 [Aldrovandia affinis]
MVAVSPPERGSSENRSEQQENKNKRMDPPTEMQQEGEAVHETVIGAQKPLHRFVSGEPKCIGIAVLFFGCGELLMGIPLVTTGSFTINSSALYIPFWLGALFVISGVLSIYTEGCPSKKMVTVCLSLYVVTLMGVLVSLCYRAFCLTMLEMRHYGRHRSYSAQVITTEAVLLTLSLCVSVLLVFLSCRARAALKSTKTQVASLNTPRLGSHSKQAPHGPAHAVAHKTH